MNAIIVHGSYGSPEENWFPWLKGELEAVGWEVSVPEFPTPEGQSLESWNAAFKEYEQHIDESTVFIGHSLGAAFVLWVLERISIQIRAAFLVAGFVGKLGNPEFDEINKTFVKREFDWEKIRQNCRSFVLLHSDNDPYVELENALEIGEGLGTEPLIVEGAGHFDSKAGYDQFPLLLEKIMTI